MLRAPSISVSTSLRLFRNVDRHAICVQSTYGPYRHSPGSFCERDGLEVDGEEHVVFVSGGSKTSRRKLLLHMHQIMIHDG